ELLDSSNILEEEAKYIKELSGEEVLDDNLEELGNIEESLSLEDLENIEEGLEELEHIEEDISESVASEEESLSLDKYMLIDSEDGTKIKRTSYAKDNIDLENAVFSDEQNYVVEHIYSEEQDELIKEVSEKDSVTEEELEELDFVEEFDLNNFFANKSTDSSNISEDDIEVPDLDDDTFIPVNDEDLAMSDEELDLPDIEDEEPRDADLLKEDNLKEDEKVIEYDKYNNRDVVVPDIDNVDYIDESNYINEADNTEDDVIQLSGNELDLITKDFDINEKIDNDNISDKNDAESSDEELEEIDDGYINTNEEDITDDYRENNYTLSEMSDEELEEIDDGYINTNEEDITDDYRENNYTLSEMSDEELEEIDDNYEYDLKKEELLSDEIKEASSSDIEDTSMLSENIAENESNSSSEEDLSEENVYISDTSKEPEEASLEELSEQAEGVSDSSEEPLELKEELPEEKNVEETSEPTNDYIKRMHEEYLNNHHTEDNIPYNDDYISKFKNLHEEYIKENVKKEEETSEVSEDIEEEIEDISNQSEDLEESKEDILSEEITEQTDEIEKSSPEPTNDYIKRMHEEYLNNHRTEDNIPYNDDYISKFKNLHEEYIKENVKKEEETPEVSEDISNQSEDLEENKEYPLPEDTNEQIEELAEEEIINNEEDLTEEEKSMYHSYLNGDQSSNDDVSEEVETSEVPTTDYNEESEKIEEEANQEERVPEELIEQ
ncbi:hypothetical protein R4K54_14020, partial [Brachyspira murdochii]|uniref:hypothetical protein n=1 Tax=Brachyspira murdochii TaxID=84378 RepID=UPI0030077413